MVRPMVHSTKHYVQTSLSSITAPGQLNTTIAQSVAVVDKDAVFEVEEGANIKAVYFEYWLKTGETSNSGFYTMTIHKIPGGGANFSQAEMAALGGAPNKKNILFTSQGLLNTPADSATNVIRSWIKIPKSKQRFGLGDFLMMSILASAIDIDLCGFATYKEYT